MSFRPRPSCAGIVAVLALAALSCGPKSPPTLYYVLNLAVPAPASGGVDRTAALMPVRVGRLISQGRVVYRESPEQVGFYEYHRWAEDPRESVARALAGALMAQGTFASVAPFDGRAGADFLVRAELRRLEEVDYGGPPRATAEIAIEVVDTASGRVQWQGSATQTETVSTSEVRAVVAAMGAAVDGVLRKLVGELHTKLGPVG